MREDLEIPVKNATKNGYLIARGGRMRLISHILTVRSEEEEWG